MNDEKLSRNKLKAELNKIPASAFVLKKAIKNEVIGFSIFGATLPIILLSRKNINITQTGDGRMGIQITTIILQGTALFFILRSNKQFKKAVALHNDHIVKQY